jgi:hypothetical protein
MRNLEAFPREEGFVDEVVKPKAPRFIRIIRFG